MKQFIYQAFLICLITLFAASCSNDIHKIDNQDVRNPLTLEEMESIVNDQLSEGHIFYWDRASDHTLWSAGMLSDSIFSIGYQPQLFQDIASHIHSINIKDEQWMKAQQIVENKILEHESVALRNPSLTMDELMPLGKSEYFPHIIVRLTSPSLIAALRDMPQVRFVEPIGFNMEDLLANYRSGSGCNGSPNYNINSNDYTTIAPATKAAWNFYTHEIDQAWSQAQGDDATICIIDTGASDDQDNLGSQFTSGQSGGRYVKKYSTLYSGSWWWRSLDSPHDDCGHGTSMAGLATAPRGTDGNSVGVAYKANLISVRAVNDVIISSSNERKGVRDALFLAGNRSDVQIVSMSIGTPFYSSTVADGIYYAYNKGLMLFAAAGTSFSWTSWFGVIFPATMSQTVAVTGVKDSPNNVKCSNCHSGSQVDFVVVMERSSNDDRLSISLATSTNQPKYIGGSSAATATTAGIAGLVWGSNPSFNRSDVLTKLKNASEYYPSRNSQFGWGRIDANDAIQ